MGRNWMWSFACGVAKRKALEMAAAEQGIAECDIDRAVPFHSHDGTMQSQFAKGWRSVTPAEVYESRNKHRFKILTTGNSKVAEHCARLRALFAEPANKESSCSR